MWGIYHAKFFSKSTKSIVTDEGYKNNYAYCVNMLIATTLKT